MAKRDDNDMTRNNLLYLVIGALAVGVAVLGYQETTTGNP
jgi:hypothetical protein